METLQPTLWRTCRMLANVYRIRCLKVVLENPGLCVGKIAEEMEVPDHHASLYLRALQARGLLRAHRKSRWVYYSAIPDPLVPSAEPIIHAMRSALLTERRSERDLLRDLTAFTHPRRLAILICLLGRGHATAEELTRATHISPPALSRHLKKLSARSLIAKNGDDWQPLPCDHNPARTLLSLLAPSDSTRHDVWKTVMPLPPNH